MSNYIPEDKVSEIKNTADIVDVVSEVVNLKRSGKNYLGLCPFHTEKTPSFTVSPEKQIFYCFGCATGGNVFSFIMKHDGISFPDAAGMLARRYGIDIPTQAMSPEQKRRISERENLLAINKEAMIFFRQELLDGVSGKRAMAYLKKRGMDKEVLDSFNLGYAPEGWDNLVNLFSKKKISHALVEKSGLIVSRKTKSGFYDRFRDRIIFPIFDLSMQVIGFGGRVLDDSMPKFLNSPETPVYNKRRSLYGMHKAKNKCRESGTVYIVEGYFDLLSLHQHGIENAVATLGTSLTTEHVRLLKGYADKVVLVFDSDDAGIKAAFRSIGIFMREEVDASIIVLPVGYDPDSYLFEFGYESFVDAASKAQEIMFFLIDSAVKKHGLSIEGKIRAISELKGPLASINDNIKRSLYIKELAERVNIDEVAVLEKIREISAQKNKGAKKAMWSNYDDPRGSRKTGFQDKVQGKTLNGKWGKLERQIIAMMLQFPQIIPEIAERNMLDLFEDKALKSIGQLVLKHKDSSEIRVSDIMIDDKEQENMMASLSMGEDIWDYESCRVILARFESIRNKSEKKLIEQIKAAEKDNDLELLAELLDKKQKMAVLSEKKKMTLLR